MEKAVLAPAVLTILLFISSAICAEDASLDFATRNLETYEGHPSHYFLAQLFRPSW